MNELFAPFRQASKPAWPVIGDLVKAGHRIQVFPFPSLRACTAQELLRTGRPRPWTVLMLALGLVSFYDLPAMLTHYALVA